jgi:hypothetical protein
VGGENKRRVRALLIRHVRKLGVNKLRPCLYEERMVVPTGTILDSRRMGAQFRAGVGNILLIALPARFGSMRRKNKTEHVLDSAASHS